MKGPFGIYLTTEAVEAFKDTFLGQFISASGLLVAESFNPEPYYLSITFRPPLKGPLVSHAHEFLIPHHFVLFVVSQVDQCNLGFHSTAPAPGTTAKAAAQTQ